MFDLRSRIAILKFAFDFGINLAFEVQFYCILICETTTGCFKANALTDLVCTLVAVSFASSPHRVSAAMPSSECGSDARIVSGFKLASLMQCWVENPILNFLFILYCFLKKEIFFSSEYLCAAQSQAPSLPALCAALNNLIVEFSVTAPADTLQKGPFVLPQPSPISFIELLERTQNPRAVISRLTPLIFLAKHSLRFNQIKVDLALRGSLQRRPRPGSVSSTRGGMFPTRSLPWTPPRSS